MCEYYRYFYRQCGCESPFLVYHRCGYREEIEVLLATGHTSDNNKVIEQEDLCHMMSHFPAAMDTYGACDNCLWKILKAQAGENDTARENTENQELAEKGAAAKE
jgi:hypothetical protein